MSTLHGAASSTGAYDDRPDDPYLAWTRLTGYSGHAVAAAHPQAPIPLLIKAGVQRREELRKTGFVTIAGAWTGHEGEFFTATALRSQLEAVEPLVDAMEFALPVAAGAVSSEPLPRVETQGDVVLAVIDHGCAFLNASFCEGPLERASNRDRLRKTRLIALWDQGRFADEGSAWRSPTGFGYGRELDRDEINRQLTRLTGARGKTEVEVYGELAYLLDGAGRLRDTAHGTHVLDTAGGSIESNPPRSSAKPSNSDAAAAALLIFVDVPSSAHGDTTGASNGAFLLDALRYIRHRAGRGAQVVVNISLGAFAGPHDGTSMVEQAIDDFVDKDGNMVITVAAGNAALERWHASGALTGASTVPADLRWRTLPEDRTDSFLEVWFAADNSGGAAEVKIQVTPPNGPPTEWLGADALHEIHDDDARRVGAVIGRQPKAGRKDAMFLVAIGPAAGARRMAPPGLWRIALRNATAGTQARFDAWIQRDEPAWDTGALSMQSHFEWASPGVIVGGAAGGLSSLATGKQTFVVGATTAEDGRLSRYSSLGGRSRRNGAVMRDIDTAAHADESQTAIGLLAAGVRSFTLTRMGGTSVAAPAMARYIYDDLVQRRMSLKSPSAGSLVDQVRKRLPAWRRPTAGGNASSLTVPLLLPEDGAPPATSPSDTKPGASGSRWSVPRSLARRVVAWLRQFSTAGAVPVRHHRGT